MEENSDVRNMLLAELIDKMHGRLADKMFPPDASKDDQPAVTGITQPTRTAAENEIPTEIPPAVADEKSIDVDNDATGPEEDDDLEELMRKHGV